MSSERLYAEIVFVLDGCNIDVCVGFAALNDFVRKLHEVFTKSHRDQIDLLSQVQTALGSTPAHHLARLIRSEEGLIYKSYADAEYCPLYNGAVDIWKGVTYKSYAASEYCPLYDGVVEICKERGILLNDGRALFSHFIKALDEERFDQSGGFESESFKIYWTVGPEAAYHLAGLHVGDEEDAAFEELNYLDNRLKRFYTTVQRWEMEREWDQDNDQ
jgi:hypothetical protein